MKKITSKEVAVRAALFFIKNKTQAYISLGEVLAGRAENLSKWKQNAQKVIERELIAAAKNRRKVGRHAYVLHGPEEEILALVITNTIEGGISILEDIIVKKNVRGRGVGHKVIKMIHDALASQGTNIVFLESGVKNLHAQKLFSSLGYKVTAVTMHKKLRRE